MESNEREAKLKASSRQRATQGQIDDGYQPIRARIASLLLSRIFNTCLLVADSSGGSLQCRRIFGAGALNPSLLSSWAR